MKQIIVIGEMDNSDGSFECCNRVYDRKMSCPTIPTSAGGGHIPKVIKNAKNFRTHRNGR